MKRLIFTISLLVSVLSAGAWNRSSYAAIMTLASQQLPPEVGATIKSTIEEGSAVSKLSLTFSVDENYLPMRSGESDALVVVEQCVERLRRNKRDNEAIALLAKAITDLHSVPNIRIKDNDFSHNNFVVRRWNNREGRLARYTNVKWRAMWNSYFPGRHHLFTPEMYAYDIDLYHARYRAMYAEGGVAEWSMDIAKEHRAVYSENLTNMHILTQERVNEYEFIHDRLMAKAAYRLAALLNEILR